MFRGVIFAVAITNAQAVIAETKPILGVALTNYVTHALDRGWEKHDIAIVVEICVNEVVPSVSQKVCVCTFDYIAQETSAHFDELFAEENTFEEFLSDNKVAIKQFCKEKYQLSSEMNVLDK